MRRLLTAGLMVLLLVAAGAAPASAAAEPGDFGISVLSSPRADLVTGGQTLVRVTPPRGVAADRITVTLDRRDVTGAFVAQSDHSLLGLVTGVPEGRSLLVASARRGWWDVLAPHTALLLRNHPITGPVFSGPKQLPFFCETTAFGLAPAVAPNCEAPAVVSFRYRTTAGAFAPLADPASRPADLAQATVDGRSVPYIIRLERGVIDRAVYEIAALFDGAEPAPTRPNGAWNGRLVYTFGGGCNVGYHQGATTGGVLNDLFLSQGYAVASSSLNVLDNNCSPVISAEVAMMVKEHVIEAYGPVAHTIGFGGSGGAIQQYGIADNYPGILDGIIPALSFPDPITTGPTVGDCRLLNRYFTAGPVAFTPEQRTAVSGYGSFGSCVSWDRSFASRGNATEACPSAIPVEFLYNPTTNPGGIKCTTAEQLVTQLGRDPQTGFARSYVDNIGVQYGLSALRAGQITPAQFVDLNAHVGGYDVAGNVVATRTEADPLALLRVYRSGLVMHGDGGLATTPIIDLRSYTDSVNDIHTRFWSFTSRQRLIDANGDAANQAILVAPLTPTPANPSAYALDAMERWLSAIDADTSHRGARAKVVHNRPADLSDGCWTATGQLVKEAATWQGPGTCNSLYPSFADTRIAAGAPLRDDVLKCRLKPLNFADYAVTFTAEEQATLRATFPTGVCDYRRPAVGKVPAAGVWQDYGDG